MKGMWVGYDAGCTMGLTLGHGAWQIDQPSNGSMWNSYSFQPVGQWMGYSFTDLGAEGCCRSLNALLSHVLWYLTFLLQCMCNQKILSNCPLCLSIQCLYQLWGQPLCYHCVQVAACNWQSHRHHQPWTHRSGGWNHYRCILGPNTIQRCLLTGLGNTLVEIRWSKDHLISTPVFPLVVRHHLCVESGPWVSFQYDVYPKV